MTAPTTERTYTLDEYLALPDDGKKYELVNGRLIEMPGPSVEHSDIVENLTLYLLPYVHHNNLGRVQAEAAFSYDPANPNNARRPDLAFIAASRRAGIDRSKNYKFVPDLAIEVISPTDVWYEIEDKIREYQQFGVRLIWVISPPSQNVFAYHTSYPAGILLHAADDLNGEDVVPGFSIKVSALFAPSHATQQP